MWRKGLTKAKVPMAHKSHDAALPAGAAVSEDRASVLVVASWVNLTRGRAVGPTKALGSGGEGRERRRGRDVK